MPNIKEVTVPERGKRDKNLRQRALIEAATAIFAEHGYEGATTNEIAQRAGCSEGLIHRYFSGKRGLLLAIMDTKVGEAVEDFTSGVPDSGTVEEEIERIILWHLKILWERREFMRVAVPEATISPEIGRMVSERVNKPRVNLILEKLRRHQEAGRIGDDVELTALAEAIGGLGLVLGFFAQVVEGMDREYVRRVAIGAAAVLSRGLKPTSQAKSSD
ncbi:MAG: TetR/AcrR family transcriptional regulator [Dehalococcoidia bacterium]